MVCKLLPKNKRTNLFCLLFYSSQQTNQICPFVFFGESTARQFVFRFYLTFSGNSSKKDLVILTIFILITQDDARKLLVTSIASNIYENLKQNGDVKDILSLVFEKNKRDNMLQNLADTMVLRGIQKSDNLQYKPVGQGDDGRIVLLFDRLGIIR